MGQGDEILAGVATPTTATARRQAVDVVSGNVNATTVQPTAPTSTVARVTGVEVNKTAFAASTTFSLRTVQNNSATAFLAVKFGQNANQAAGNESWTVLLGPKSATSPGGFASWKREEYSGQVDMIWDVADAAGEVLTTETGP